MIKVTRLKIEREEIAVPNRGTRHFIAVFQDQDRRSLLVPEDALKAMSMVEIKKLEYRVQEFRYRQLSPRYYLIRPDAYDSLNELLDVSKAEYDRIVADYHRQGHMEGWTKGVNDAKRLVKTLPWWARLFNRF